AHRAAHELENEKSDGDAMAADGAHAAAKGVGELGLPRRRHQAIAIALGVAERKRVDGRDVRVAFFEAAGVDDEPDAILRRQNEVKAALGTAPQRFAHALTVDGGAAVLALGEGAARHAALERLFLFVLLFLARPPGAHLERSKNSAKASRRPSSGIMYEP